MRLGGYSVTEAEVQCRNNRADGTSLRKMKIVLSANERTEELPTEA